MAVRVDLVPTGPGPVPEWPLGETHPGGADPAELERALGRALAGSDAAAWLLWDPALGAPDAALVGRLLEGPADVAHAGLALGQGGRPGLLDFVHPTWMLQPDPDPTVDASSWRVSLRACLVRTAVLERLGGPRGGLRSLAGAGLEAGHRWIWHGAVVRHAPGLAPAGAPAELEVPLADEIRFLRAGAGRKWAAWAALRAATSGAAGPLAAARAWRGAGRSAAADPPPLRSSLRAAGRVPADPRVSVLIATVDRYPWLRTLLAQLAGQTVAPAEVLVVDQTPAGRREVGLAAEFPALPLRVIVREEAGQCSSRNAGLEAATGRHVLFLDDDVEVGPTLIEDHLRTLDAAGAEVSSGVADEVGAGPLPAEFRRIRVSDVFPTNNTMVRAEVLAASGLFDLAYDRGQRADGDLGRRIYWTGALMVLNPEISVLHHRAPRGGLRVHGARVDTYAASRRRLTARNLPTVSDLYLARRHGTPRQVREAMVLGALGTLAGRGGRLHRVLKAALGVARLPDTIWRIRRRAREADRLLERYPRIPSGDRFAGAGES